MCVDELSPPKVPDTESLLPVRVHIQAILCIHTTEVFCVILKHGS